MLTSSMLPTETKYEKPMPSSIAQSSTEVHSAPGLGDEADVSLLRAWPRRSWRSGGCPAR